MSYLVDSFLSSLLTTTSLFPGRTTSFVDLPKGSINGHVVQVPIRMGRFAVDGGCKGGSLLFNQCLRMASYPPPPTGISLQYVRGHLVAHASFFAARSNEECNCLATTPCTLHRYPMNIVKNTCSLHTAS